jgi:hypothetical protein
MIAGSLLLMAPVFAQTRVDLTNQSKKIDFSNMPLVRPFRTGTPLPATCAVGEMFFKTDAPSGSNAFGCVSPNSWVLEGQGSAVSTPALTPLQVVWTNSTTLTIGPTCAVATPCLARIGAIAYSFAAPGTATVQTGSGLAYVYVSSGGALTVGTSGAGNPAMTCSGCQTLNTITQFPVDSIPLAVWNATAGTWDPTGTDDRALLSGGRTVTAGENIIITESGNNITIAATVANPADAPAAPTSGSTSGSGTAYDPTNMTVIDRDYVFAEFGVTGGAPWGYTGGTCGIDIATPGTAGEPAGLGWLATGDACIVFYPGASGGYLPMKDFISGSAPLTWSLKGRYARADRNSAAYAGDHYIGWSSARDGTVANFVGIRFLNSAGVWQCVIRSGGADVAAQTIPIAPDAAVHTFAVSGGSSANSVTCGIDTATQSATGTIPASSWYGMMGTNVATGYSTFTTIEARIHIAGLAR